ncbi:MAG: GTP-binding protein [Sedimentisphaerales bacterium]|nr:GTP-binding protein [Sedimentisphaerales bacterium]
MTSSNRDCRACLTTGKEAAAIATIKLFGADALSLIKSLFLPAAGHPVDWNAGTILTGHIVDGDRVIDQVVVGIQEHHILAVHCHGNPLIIEAIMELLQRQGARLSEYEPILAEQIRPSVPNRIAAEAQIEQLKSVTIEGVKILAGQIHGGLTAWCAEALARIDTIDFAQLCLQGNRILQRGRIAARILHGCKTAIVGPPNSGKSTLLNALAGRELAIVTETAGTTRDYVTATCRIPSLRLELFDTAGLDPSLAAVDPIESAAQQQTRNIIQQADLILLVLDASRLWKPFDPSFLRHKPTLVVLNKIDLGCRIDKEDIELKHASVVRISAKQKTGTKELVEAIRHIMEVLEFDPKEPIVFTDRQTQLLQSLTHATNRAQAIVLVDKLLHG